MESIWSFGSCEMKYFFLNPVCLYACSGKVYYKRLEFGCAKTFVSYTDRFTLRKTTPEHIKYLFSACLLFYL
jgi:hypothetical protein